MIHLPHTGGVIKNVPDQLEEGVSQHLPLGLVKNSLETIQSRGFEGPKTLDGVPKLLFRNLFAKMVGGSLWKSRKTILQNKKGYS